MKLDLTEIAHNIGERQRYTIEEPCWEDEEAGIRCNGQVTGYIEFSNAGRLIIARGQLKASLEQECGRCLTNFETPVETKIEEEFEISNYQADGDDFEDDISEGSSDDEPLFVDNVFDLSEYIRQNLVLALPLQPLCSELCKGLCEQCGQNLNLGACQCPKEVESPLAGLAELLEAREQKGEEGKKS